MFKRLNKIILISNFFFLLTAIITAYIWNIESYTVNTVINIFLNFSTLILGIVLNIFILTDRKYLSFFNKYFIISLWSITYACTFNLFQWILVYTLEDSIIYLMLDSLRFVLDQSFSFFISISFVEYLNLNIKKMKKIVIFFALITLACIISHFSILLYGVMNDLTSDNFIFLSTFPEYILILIYTITLIFAIKNYSSQNKKSIHLFVFLILLLLSNVSYFYSDLELSYPMCILSLFGFYNFVYVRQKFNIDNHRIYSSKIQKSIANTNFKMTRPNVDLYARVLAAKDITGSFYDFYMIDETHLVFTLADINEKGFPAAIRMVEMISVLRGIINTSTHVNGIAQLLSYKLKKFNTKFNATTLWIGILDTETNILSYVDACHTKFMVIRNNQILKHDNILSPKIGDNSNKKFRKNEIQLQNSDSIILFNKGIEEYIYTKDKNADVKSCILEFYKLNNNSSQHFIDKLYLSVLDKNKKKTINYDLVMLCATLSKKSAVVQNNLKVKKKDFKYTIKVNQKNYDDKIILIPEGTLDISTQQQFISQCSSKIKQNHKLIIINFKNLRTLTPSGIHAIINLQQKYGDRMIVSFLEANKNVCTYIRKYGLDQVFVVGEQDG